MRQQSVASGTRVHPAVTRAIRRKQTVTRGIRKHRAVTRENRRPMELGGTKGNTCI